MLFDTDVIIWALRGNARAAAAVESGQPLCTANAKDYRVIAELALKVFRP